MKFIYPILIVFSLVVIGACKKATNNQKYDISFYREGYFFLPLFKQDYRGFVGKVKSQKIDHYNVVNKFGENELELTSSQDFHYDYNGNLIVDTISSELEREYWFNLTGKSLPPRDTTLIFYDNKGLKQEERELRGDIIRIKRTFAYNSDGSMNNFREYIYDEYRFLIAVYNIKFNEDGNIASVDKYDPNNKIKNRELYKYENGYVVEHKSINYISLDIKKEEFEFDDEGRLVVVFSYDKNSNIISKDVYEYNDFGFIESHKTYCKKKYDNIFTEFLSYIFFARFYLDSVSQYAYEYDKSGNWISKTYFNNREPKSKEIRTLEYY